MEFKPRPYTKREFLSKFNEPYVNPDTNEVIAPLTETVPSAEVTPGQPEINRALEVSLKDDTNNKTFSIGLKDIDSAILYYLDNVIKPTVTQNDRRIAVLQFMVLQKDGNQCKQMVFIEIKMVKQWYLL